MSTTVGTPVPPFQPLEMEAPDVAVIGTAFDVKVKITAAPATGFAYAAWTNERDRGTVSLRIELYADTIGPGTDLKLATHNELLISGQDTYDITLNPRPVFPAGADKVVYELAAVVTLVEGANALNGFAAFVGDALIQVR